MSLMIMSGPFGTNGVQEWTHSVTSSADFVFPPLAQFFGLQAELEEILSQQGFQMTTKWYDPRIDADLHHLARGATQDWGACVDGSPSRASPGFGAGDYMDNSVSIEPSWDFARGVDGAVLQTYQSSDCHLNCSATSCTVCRAFVHRQHCSIAGHASPSGKFWHDFSEIPQQVATCPAYEAAVATSRVDRRLRSCLKAGLGVGGERVRKRASFGFGVSFWFPARTQLQRTCHLHPPGGLAAPHDVSSTISSQHLPFWDFGHVHMQAIPAPVVEPAASDALKGPISFLSFASLPASEGCIPDVGSQELSSPAAAGGNLCPCNPSVGRIPDGSFTYYPCEPRAVRSPPSSVGAIDAGVFPLSASWGRRLTSCSSSVGLVSELSNLDGFLPCFATSDRALVSHAPPLLSNCDIPIWECARKKPQSKQAAFRLGAAPYCPLPVRNPGLHKPLSDAGHFQVAEPLVLAPAEEVLNPYSSFDAVNGARTLAAEADWPTDRYITYAIDTARLPGNPLARFLRFELVDHPEPQVALTQDHGIARLRAVVFDFRPFQGQVEVIDTPPSVSTLEQVRLSRTINDIPAAVDAITGHACTTIVNGAIAPPLATLPMDADLVLFQLWQDGAPLNTWRPYQFGDARPPVPPIPDSADAPSASQGFRVFTGASSTRPAAVPRHSPISVAPEGERYTFMDIRIGVSNRPKPPPGAQQACLADAMLAVPRGAQPPLGARIIERALPGLHEPQVIVTRVTHDRGWHTIALDLRQVNLGIKVLHVRLGSSIRQLFSYDSPLQHELVQLGRGAIVFSYMMNLESCLLDTAFHVRTDTLTLTPLAGQHPGHSVASSSAPSRWARRLQPQPLEVVTSLIEGSEGLFTVFDTVHHYRILRCEHSDTPEILTARALSLTPELPGAEGILLLHGIAELPFPQIILVPAGSGDLIVPLLYKINPVSVCTSAVPPDASAFMVAYHASNSCKALTGAQHQIARRTAAIVGHHGSVDPFRSGCATEHGVLVLRGYSFASAALRRRLRSAGQPSPDFVEARSWEPHDDLSVEDTHRIRVFRARGLPGSVSIVPTATLRSIREYISLYCPSGPPAALRWPTVCPGLPGAVPVVVALSEEALDEARHWALVDIRRVGHPPLLPFQTVPLPAMVDLRTVLSLMRHELPTLRPISGAYFNDYALTEDPRMAGDIMLLTLMRWEPDRDSDAGAVIPALDINLDLLERRVALHAFFNRYAPRVQGHGLALSSTSPSITEDSTDASASFHSGSLPEDLDADAGLALEAIGTLSTTTTSCPGLDSTSTTTGTPATRTGASSSRSPGPRACNLVSSIEDVWAAGIRIYAVCGNCRPLHLEVASPVCLAAVLTHFTEAFAEMGLLPDAAHWLLSPRAHWLWNGELGVFLTTGWGSLEPRSVAIWIEPGHRWKEPFVTSVPNHASREQILACVRIPGIERAVLSIDGVIWDGTPRFFHNGEVLQLRSTWHRMGSLPNHLVGDRIWGLFAMHCGCYGPARIRHAPLCGEARTRHTRGHFDAWLTPFMDRFLPSSTFNNIFLVVQTGPFLCLSLGTRLPPSVEDVQRFYDDYVLPAHGPRCVEDVKLVWNDACIFLARTPEFPCQLWLLLGEPSLDSIQLDYGQDLSQWPSPPDRVWFPGETKGNVGIAFLQDIATAAETPGPSRLFNIPAKPPWPVGVPEVAFSDDEIHGDTRSARSLFGSSSGDDTSVFEVHENAAPARPSQEPAATQQPPVPDRPVGFTEGSSSSSSSSSSSGSSSGNVLLQVRAKRLVSGLVTEAPVDPVVIRRIPTPCRSRKVDLPTPPEPPVQCILGSPLLDVSPFGVVKSLGMQMRLLQP